VLVDRDQYASSPRVIQARCDGLDEAIEQYKAALQIAPNDPVTRERLDAAMTKRAAAGRATPSKPAVKPEAGSE
jgi:hypothetical protein